MTRSTRSLRSCWAGIAAMALLLTGCAGAPAPAADAPPGGGADAPPGGGDDGRIVLALDDFAALNALSLGVRPDLVLEVFEYTTTSAVFDQAQVTTRPYGTALDVEQVAAADPDVIIGVSLPTTLEVQEELGRIAPTTVLDYTASWQDQLASTAEALGVPERAAGLREQLETDLTTLSADLAAAGRAGTTVSVLGDSDGPFSVPTATAAGTVLDGAGLARPADQQQATTAGSPFIPVSAESLADHGGEVVYLLAGGPYRSEGLTGSPLWPQLESGAAAGTHPVSGETWLGSSAFTVDWIIRDLRATLLEGGRPAADADAPARFRDFVATG